MMVLLGSGIFRLKWALSLFAGLFWARKFSRAGEVGSSGLGSGNWF
jgi:hypothetical protein